MIHKIMYQQDELANRQEELLVYFTKK